MNIIAKLRDTKSAVNFSERISELQSELAARQNMPTALKGRMRVAPFEESAGDVTAIGAEIAQTEADMAAMREWIAEAETRRPAAAKREQRAEVEARMESARVENRALRDDYLTFHKTAEALTATLDRIRERNQTIAEANRFASAHGHGDLQIPPLLSALARATGRQVGGRAGANPRRGRCVVREEKSL